MTDRQLLVRLLRWMRANEWGWAVLPPMQYSFIDKRGGRGLIVSRDDGKILVEFFRGKEGWVIAALSLREVIDILAAAAVLPVELSYAYEVGRGSVSG